MRPKPIIAADRRVAADCARHHGLRSDQWRHLTDPNDLLSLKNGEIWLTYGWQESVPMVQAIAARRDRLHFVEKPSGYRRGK